MNNSAIPKISVIIPTYNHARYLGRAIQSVLNQTYVNFEVIVIDNYSTDNTEDVMRSFAVPQISYHKIRNEGIIAASRNLGVRKAQGEWVAFLDSDDWWTADKLETCVRNINENTDLIYHNMILSADHPTFFRRTIVKTWKVKPPVLTDLLLKGNPIVNSSVMVRRSLLENIGGINETVELVTAEDYNTWLRIARLTNRFVYIQSRLGYYYQHTQSISQKDTSKFERNAVNEFVQLLNPQQQIILEANFRYSRGRHFFRNDNYSKAAECLWFSLRHGRLEIKMKSALLLFIQASKRMIFEGTKTNRLD